MKKGIQLTDLLQQELLNGVNEDGDDDSENDEMLRIQFELNQELRKMVGRLRETKNISVLPVPNALRRRFTPLSKTRGHELAPFLREHGFGACLADDMGLGKTVQMIAYLLHVKGKEGAGKELPAAHRDEQKSEPIIVEEDRGTESSDEAEVIATAPESVSVQSALIVCPTSVLGNWQKELEKFAPSLKVHLHYGSNRAKGEAFTKLAAEHDIVLTSYGLTHQDVAELTSIHWSSVILDEAQNIKECPNEAIQGGPES